MRDWFAKRGFTIFGIVILTLTLPARAHLFQIISSRTSALGPPAGGSGDSGSAIISADGRYVLFASAAENLVQSTNDIPAPPLQPHYLNVFLRDRTNGTTKLVSANLTGNSGNGDSLPAGISANGRFALFESAASDLVVGDSNGAGDVFLRDVINGTTLRVSVAANGGSANGPSRNAVMTPDGRYVTFVSTATNLVAGDNNGIPDVFVRDVQSGITTLVSTNARGAFPASSDLASITPDGRCVAFYSSATNLVSGVTTSPEIYARDLFTGTTAWVSTNAQSIALTTVGSSNVVVYYPQISTNGQYVVFTASTSANRLILRHNLQSGITEVIHTNAAVVTTGPDMTPDGRFVAFVGNVGSIAGTNTTAYRWDAQTGMNTTAGLDFSGLLPASTLCDWAQVNASGRYVSFLSTATNLTTNPSTGGRNLFVRDMQAGVTRLVNEDANGEGTGLGSFTTTGLSEDGRFIVFNAPDGKLVGNDWNRAEDVFVRDIFQNQNELISARHPDLPSQTASGPSGFGLFSVSADGRYVAFTSEADDLVMGDTNGNRDVFVRDILAGSNILVSVAADGGGANGMSYLPAISGDGRYVAFTSYATDLVPGDTNFQRDVFVRDLQTGSNILVSARYDGAGSGNGYSYLPSISSDGRYVLFRSSARDLVLTSYGSGTENLFLRDLVLRTNHALTTSDVMVGAMTLDGRYIIFASGNSVSGNGPVRLWDSQQRAIIYTNNLGYYLWSVAISQDGQHYACEVGYLSSTLYVGNRVTNGIWAATSQQVAHLRGLQFSSDGRYLVYSTSTAVTPDDLNSLEDVYLYDFQTRTNLLISRSFNGGALNAAAYCLGISPDGRFIAYRTAATNVVPNDFNGWWYDLVLYDRINAAPVLVSVDRSTNRTANHFSLGAQFSPDSRILVFQSWASDMTAGDFNNASDVFAIQLAPAAITDSDHDGMDDQWEMSFFGSLDRNGLEDWDEDGALDRFEFQAGTNPTNATSALRADIALPAARSMGPTVSWPTTPWKSYRVQYKNNLKQTNWYDLPAGVSLFDSSAVIHDPSPAVSNRFYRILVDN